MVKLEVYIFDVKEFELRPIPTGLFFRDPYARIREKINYVRKQFKYFKDRSCCLVLYSFDPMVELYDWIIMLSAMYGDFGLSIPVDTEKGETLTDAAKQSFLARGKMFRLESSKPQNTTISAIISLRHVHVGEVRQLVCQELQRSGESISPEDADFDIDEKCPAAIVWENAFARIPFPRELFSGFYDERWGLDGDFITRVFAGEGILSCEEIFNSES